MVSVVLLLAIANLALGFGLAVLLERPFSVPTWLPVKLPALGRIRPMLRHRLASGWSIRRSASAAAAVPAPLPRPRNEFPWLKPEWSACLDRWEIPVSSLPEAILWLASIRLSEWCDRIQMCDGKLREGNDEPARAEVAAIVREFTGCVAEWSQSLQSAAAPGATIPSLELVASLLARLEQRGQSLETPRQPNHSESAETGSAEPLALDMLPTFSTLRKFLDDCHETQAQFLRSAQRLEYVPPGRLSLAEPQLLSRIGLAKLIEDWEKNDSEHIRIASVVLVDMDQCQQLNAKLGLIRTSEILTAVRPILVEVLRQGRRYDRVATLSGQCFLLFLGDTALRNATTGAERVRQNLQAARIRVDGEPVSVFASCAVGEWSSGETFDQLLDRLRLGLAESKQTQRNCTIVCESNSTRVVRSAELSVAHRDLIVGVVPEPVLAATPAAV